MSSSASSAPQCHNCRKRRIRCDSALPTCKKCARKGIDCPGYGKKKPLVWLEGGGYQNQHLTEGNKPSSERKPRKSGRPRIVVAKDDDQKMTIGTLIRANPTAHGLRPIIRGVPETLDVKYPMETKLVVGSLWYFYEKLYPDINPFMHDQNLPPLDTKGWQDDITNIFLHILVSSVAAHKEVQSQHANERFQQSASGGWVAHFEGARRMIELKGGIKAVSNRAAFLRPLLRYFMLTDVFSITTSPIVSTRETIQQLEYLPLLSDVYRDATETTIPCPNDLFDSVIRINYLRAVPKTVCDDDAGISFVTSVQVLLQRTLSFSPGEWADRKALEYGTSTDVAISKPVPNFVWPGKDTWWRVATIFQAAVILYCIRSLGLDIPDMLLMHRPPGQETGSQIGIEDLHDSTRKILFKNLYAVFSSKTEDERTLGKVLVWPLFVAGVEAGDDDNAAQERELIGGALRSLSISIGTLNLRDAEACLRNYWNRNVSREYASFHDRRRWDEVFVGVHGRCAFFI